MTDHFLNPKNIGTLENPDGIAHIQEDCEDEIKLAIKVKTSSFMIEDIKAQIKGCLYITASVSYITEKMKCNHLASAWKISAEEIIQTLQLPDEKAHCALMALASARTAVTDYMRKNRLTFHDLEMSLSEANDL